MATITTMAPTASPSSLKITTKLASLPPTSTYFSLEFFPPKTGMGMSNLRARLDRMSRALRPLFITVTWGAGGSTSAKSLELAELTQVDLGITTCLHLTCTNMSRALVDEALEGAKRLGVRNILALRGDPPREEYGDGDSDKKGSEEEGDEEELLWAVDLVRYIRKKYGDYFCIGVAAYPEGHADSSHPEVQSLEHDLPYLVEKVRTGADFIMTQLFYDVDAYKAFEETLRSHESGTFKTIPIIPGLMPIQSYQILKRTTKLSHAKVPDAILERLDEVKGDDEAVKRMGVDVMSEIVEKVKDMEETCPGPRGFHFYTLNLEKAVAFILERTGLVPDKSVDEEAVDDLEDCVPRIALNGVANIVNSTHPAKKTRRQSSVGGAPHNHVIVEKVSGKVFETTGAEAAVPKEKVNTRANTLAISEGEGTLGREATWDDFPNGRWGDARSPAYGEIASYGLPPKMTTSSATTLWGHPRSLSDITSLFIRHLEGDLSSLPWSEDGLTAETETIRPQLLSLNRKGWWTIASQPAVNGVRSNDQIFGWGPKGGFVFQKAFVEFFLPAADWETLKAKLDNDDSLSYLAANAAGGFVSSGSGEGDRSRTGSVTEMNHGETNAVTWGVFPGKEIVSPTIVEEVSFKAWAQEAFELWSVWGECFKKGSEENKLLSEVRDGFWLVNVIGHEFVRAEGLWDVLGYADGGVENHGQKVEEK